MTIDEQTPERKEREGYVATKEPLSCVHSVLFLKAKYRLLKAKKGSKLRETGRQSAHGAESSSD
jgi:hypothetical protein